MFLSIAALHLLEAFHGLEYLRNELPGLYEWLVSPTVKVGALIVALYFIITGVVEIRRLRRGGNKATAVHRAHDDTSKQETHGPNSPVMNAHDSGQNVFAPGGTVTFHQVPRSTPPRIAFIEAGPIPVGHPLSNGMQTGFHLANDGEEAAYEVHVQPFEIEPSVWAESGRLSRIAGKPGTGFALVWLKGFPATQFAVGKWRLLEAMAKAAATTHGLGIYQPSYTIHVMVNYKDGAANSYRSRADLTYIPSQHHLEFSNPIYEELGRNDTGQLIQPTATTKQQISLSPVLVDTGPGSLEPEPFADSRFKVIRIFGVRNEQIATQVTAYNVRARLKYIYADDIESFVVDPAAWVRQNVEHPEWLADLDRSVDLGSSERVRGILAVTIDGKAQTLNPPPSSGGFADEGKILKVGLWTVHGTVSADNCDPLTVQYGLQVDKHGNITSWSMPRGQPLG